MDLFKMMQVAGIGCGEDCVCAMSLVESLSDTQRGMFAHMIEHVAKQRAEAIAEATAATERPFTRPTMMDIMERLFGDDADNALDPIDTIVRAMMRERDDDTDVEPYQGELGDDITAQLATLTEEKRQLAETRLRIMIAAVADNDPSQVFLVRHGGVLTVGIGKSGATGDASSAAA